RGDVHRRRMVTASIMVLVRELCQELGVVLRRAKPEAGFNDRSFLPMLEEYGALATVERLVLSFTVPHGFTRLWELGRLDLTVEHGGFCISTQKGALTGG